MSVIVLYQKTVDLTVRVPRQLIKDYANDPNGPKMLALRAQRKHEMQVRFTVLGGADQIRSRHFNILSSSSD